MARALAPPQAGSVAVLPHLPWLAAIVSVAVAGIHFAVAPAHFDEYWLLGWFFIATAWLQATWAIALVGFGTRTSLLIAGICLNLLVVLVWVWTRTVGVPVGPEAGSAETLGWVDGITAGLEIGIIVLAAGLLVVQPAVARDRWSGLWLAVGGLVLAVLVGAVLASSGGDEHAHDETPQGAHDEAGHA
jgi:hypothetical protein